MSSAPSLLDTKVAPSSPDQGMHHHRFSFKVVLMYRFLLLTTIAHLFERNL
jgi:hypothetical protein